MTISRTLHVILGIGMAVLSCANGGGRGTQTEAERARQLILRTLDKTYSNNVSAVIIQRTAENHGTFQNVQVQISKDGKVRQCVIYPLSMQGVETIDDGKQSATFLPDENLVLVQESPRLLPNDIMTRINLTVRNYGLRLGGTSNIAGQRATIVIATPLAKDLEGRRYHIDERTGFLLQLETLDASGVARLAFKAQQVTYPANISAQTFAIDLTARAGKKIVYRRRSALFGGEKGAPDVGFEPALPQSLPYGFEVQDAQVNDTGNFRSVAVRFTDGLVKGTVYQYSLATAAKMKAMVGTTVGDGAGIRFVVAADVPEAVRKKILAKFIDQAKREFAEIPKLGLSSNRELTGDLLALIESDSVIWRDPQFPFSIG